MSKRYPKECKDDVVRVARNREKGVTLEQVAKDFGISHASLALWLKEARRADIVEPGGNDESVALRKRLRLLEQENEVLRRAAAYLGQANLPKG